MVGDPVAAPDLKLEGLVSLYLTSQGLVDLGFLLGVEAERRGIECLVRKTDAFGIWTTVAGESWKRVVIVPWRYVRAISFDIEERKGRISIKPGQR